MQKPRVALIHDYLVQHGGAEKTLEAIAELFPDAPIYTGLYKKDNFSEVINSKKIIYPKNKLLSMFSKYLTFLMPLIFENFDLREYDIVLSDSSAWAKGVLTSPEQLHISYIHTPPRFLYKYSVESTKRNKWYFKLPVAVIDSFLRVWDYKAAHRPDVLLANSNEVKKRIKKFYNLDSTVLYPPVEIEYKEVDKSLIPYSDYFITAGRVVAYKNVDLVIKTFNKLGKNLVVVGAGPELNRLKEMAGENIFFTGKSNDEEKLNLIQHAIGLINAVDNEDFGIVPIEAMSQGTPVLAYKSGGHLETIKENENGLFFDELTEESLAKKVLEFEQKVKDGHFDKEKIKLSTVKFSRERFQKEYYDFVMEKWNQHLSNR